MLVRDPFPNVHPNQYYLAGQEIERVEKLKYLGSTFLAKTLRPASIKPRNVTAIGVYKKLLPYLTKLKAPFSLLRMIYSTVILPIMTYGLNVMSMTKANRRSLARKEFIIVQGLAAISNPNPGCVTVKRLLNGKTINRRITGQRIRYYGHILRRPIDSVLRRALMLRVRKRRHGRPVFTWRDTLQGDFQQYRFNSSEWESNIHDKHEIKRMTEVICQANLSEEFDFLNEPSPLIVDTTEPDITESSET
jgi:hypothetical protein